MASRSKIDRLFRLWDCLNLLRDLGKNMRRDVGKGYLESTVHINNLRARRALRKLISKEYGVPKGMIGRSLTIKGCMHLRGNHDE